MPSIPLVGVNLVVVLSQVEILPMEGGVCVGTSISIDRSSAKKWCFSKRCVGRWKGLGDGYISIQFIGPTIHWETIRYFHGECISWRDGHKNRQI